jgi:hypothetical protein
MKMVNARNSRDEPATKAACQPHGLHGDLLIGAPAAAEVIYGDPTKTRAIYALKAKGWPFFRLGRELAIRRSTLLSFIERMERAA